MFNEANYLLTSFLIISSLSFSIIFKLSFIKIIYLFFLMLFIHLICSFYPLLSKHHFLSKRPYSHKGKIIFALCLVLTSLSLLLSKMIILIVNTVYPSFFDNKTIFQAIVFGDVVFYGNSFPFTTITIDILLDAIILMSAVYYYCSLAFSDDELLRSNEENYDERNINALYTYNKSMKSTKKIMFCILLILLSITTVFSFDISNYILLISLCVFMIMITFYKLKSVDNINCILIFILGILAIYLYAEKVFTVINDKYATEFNVVDDYNEHYIFYFHFIFLMSTFVIACLYRRYESNEGTFKVKKILKQIITANNINIETCKAIAMKKSLSYQVISYTKKSVYPLASVVFIITFLIWNFFHMNSLTLLVVITFIIAMNTKNITKISFLLCLTYEMINFAYNANGFFYVFKREINNIIEAIGMFKLYRKYLNEECTNEYELNIVSNYKIQRGLCEIMPMLFLFYITICDSKYNSNKSQHRSSIIEIKSKIGTAIYYYYMNYFLPLFLLSVSIVKFDLIHCVYFITFIILLFVSKNSTRLTIFKLSLWYNISVLILVLYFWNIILVNIFNVDKLSTSSSWGYFFNYVGLFTQTSRHFLVEYIEHILYFLLMVIHHKFSFVIQEDNIKHNNKIFLKYTILLLMMSLCVIKSYSFIGLGLMMSMLLVVYVGMFTVNKVTHWCYKMFFITCFIYSIWKYFVSFTYIGFLLQKLFIENREGFSINKSDFEFDSINIQYKIGISSVVLLFTVRLLSIKEEQNEVHYLDYIKETLSTYSGVILIVFSSALSVYNHNLISFIILIVLFISVIAESNTNWFYLYHPMYIISFIAIVLIYMFHITAFANIINENFTWLGVYDIKSKSKNILSEILPYVIIIILSSLKYAYNTKTPKISLLIYLYWFYIACVIICFLFFIQSNLITLLSLLFISFQLLPHWYYRSGYKTQREEQFDLKWKNMMIIQWRVYSLIMQLISLVQILFFIWLPPTLNIKKFWYGSSVFYLCNEKGRNQFSTFSTKSDFENCISDWNQWLSIDSNLFSIFANFLIGIIATIVYITLKHREDNREQFIPKLNEDFTYLHNRANNFNNTLMYYVFVYYRTFVLYISVGLCLIFCYNYTNLISFIIMVISIVFILTSSKIQKNKTAIWSILPIMLIISLIIISIYQFPYIQCTSLSNRSYISVSECIFLNENTTHSTVISMISSLLGLFKLNLSYSLYYYFYLLFIFALAISVDVILEHPYQHYIDAFEQRERKHNRKGRAFTIVLNSKLETIKNEREVYNTYIILNGKMNRLENKIVSYSKMLNLDSSDEEKCLLDIEKSENKLKDKCDVHLENMFIRDKSQCLSSYYPIIQNQHSTVFKNRIDEYKEIMKESDIDTEDKFIIDIMIEVNEINSTISKIQYVYDVSCVVEEMKMAQEEYRDIVISNEKNINATIHQIKNELIYKLFYINSNIIPRDSVIDIDRNSFYDVNDYRVSNNKLIQFIHRYLSQNINKELLIDMNPNHITKNSLSFLNLIPLYVLSHIEIISLIVFIATFIHEQNIIAVVYPISLMIFGFVDYPYTSISYLRFIRVYSILIILSKFIFHLYILSSYQLIQFNHVFTDSFYNVLCLLCINGMIHYYKSLGIWNYVNNSNDIKFIKNNDDENSNSFMNFMRRISPELFSDCKYKTGKNFYNKIFISQLLILLYYILIFPLLSSSPKSLSLFAHRTKVFSSKYIITVLLIILVIIIDRIIFKYRSYKLDILIHNHFLHQQKIKANYLNINDIINDPSNYMVINPQDISYSNFALALKLIMHLILLFVAHFHLIMHHNEIAYLLLYLFFCGYLYYSSLQIKYGYPIYSVALTSTKINTLSSLGFKLYRNLPFLFELKSIFDWSISNTSLDLYQWMQIEDAYCILYEVTDRMIKRKIKYSKCWLKFLYGYCLFIILVAIVIAPMMIYSQLNPSLKATAVDDVKGKMKIYIKDIRDNNTMFSYDVINGINVNIDNNVQNEKYKDILKENDLYNDNIQKIKINNYSFVHSFDIPHNNINTIASMINNNTKYYLALNLNFYRESPSSIIKSQFSHELTSKQLHSLLYSTNTSITINNILPHSLLLSDSNFIVLSNSSSSVILTLLSENSNKFIKINSDGEMLIINDKISVSSFIDNKNVTYSIGIIGLYVTVVYAIGKCVRMFFDRISQRVIYEEMKNTEPLIELCDGIDIYRKNNNLEKELYLYELLIKLYRSPEVIIAITK